MINIEAARGMLKMMIYEDDNDSYDDFDDQNLLVIKMEAARGMLKQPKSKSDTERLMMKIAVVFLT